ncbi:DNA translocase FtsK [Streptacidiphilus cavernicola]|uniref:DNA translocase FtsK n=1 Tax=Streptacidiphilus cavernicola TaxID=3342716 RepID=A0ABV6VXS9_9ACTN
MSDDLLREAAVIIVTSQFAAPDRLQRRLHISYGYAHRLLDELEQHGVVGPAQGTQPRDVLVRTVPDSLR